MEGKKELELNKKKDLNPNADPFVELELNKKKDLNPNADPFFQLDLNKKKDLNPNADPFFELELNKKKDLNPNADPFFQHELNKKNDLNPNADPFFELDLNKKKDLNPNADPFFELELNKKKDLNPNADPFFQLELNKKKDLNPNADPFFQLELNKKKDLNPNADPYVEFILVDKDLPVEETTFLQRDILKSLKNTLTESQNAVKKSWKNFTNIFNLYDDDEMNAYIEPEFPNIAFYSNEIPFYPSGDKIENILETWKGNYYLLETNHFYIQWLFPNRIPGINRQASVLMDREVEVISRTPELRGRVRKSFEMMLDFYGMRLTKDNQFKLTENSEERLKELNQWYNHNYLRITRILLALKELGHKDLMLPWMKFLADLVYKEKMLNHATSSFEKYWIDTLDAEETIELKEYLKQLRSIKPTDTKAGDKERNYDNM